MGVCNIVVQCHAPHDMSNRFVLCAKERGFECSVSKNSVMISDYIIQFVNSNPREYLGLPSAQMLIVETHEYYTEETYTRTIPILSADKDSHLFVIREIGGKCSFATAIYDRSLEGKNDFVVVAYEETIMR